jgi:hypothetical protein
MSRYLPAVVICSCLSAGWTAETVSLSVDPASGVQVGDTITVSMTLLDGQPLKSIQAAMSWSAATLQLDSEPVVGTTFSALSIALFNGTVSAANDRGSATTAFSSLGTVVTPPSSAEMVTWSFTAIAAGSATLAVIPGSIVSGNRGTIVANGSANRRTPDIGAPLSLTITTVATNQPPLVQAGLDQTITLPAQASLTGSAMDDGLPSGTLSHLWSMVSGPGVVSFSATTALTTTASFTSAGTYVLRLTTSDGALSGSDEIAVQVDPAANLPPTATAQSVGVTEDVAQAITLSGTDSDGTIAGFAIVSSPTKGTLSGSGASRTYTPNLDATGADSFTFTVTDDDGAVSAPATVTITIAAVNDPPVNTLLPVIAGTTAVGQTLTSTTGQWNDLADGIPAVTSFSYQWRKATAASGGTVTAIAGATSASYVLQAGDAGFFIEVEVTASDSGTPGIASTGVISARTAVVSPVVVNVAPVATAQSVGVSEDTTVAITLAGTDSDGTLAGFSIFRTPTKGVLSGTAPNLTYTPDPDATGADSFSFFVTDDQGATSVPAEVGLTIAAVNDPPVNTVLPVITGTVAVGQTLLAGAGTWNDAVDGNPPPTVFAYQWLRATAPAGGTVVEIPGASASSYALGLADVGFHIGIRVTATDVGTPGTASTVATATRTILVPPGGGDDVRRILLEPVAGFAWDAAGLPISATTGNRTVIGPYPSASAASLTVVPQAGG